MRQLRMLLLLMMDEFMQVLMEENLIMVFGPHQLEMDLGLELHVMESQQVGHLQVD